VQYLQPHPADLQHRTIINGEVVELDGAAGGQHVGGAHRRRQFQTPER
jgi:hypothetical protein